MMITIRAGKVAMSIGLLMLAAGCSREQQDWRSAEAADTMESYGQFIERHPDSELATQARTRVTQLGEDRDWQQAGSADTAEAYRQFLAQHPNGKWAQEARIRIENFSLGAQPGSGASTASATASAPGGETAAPAAPLQSQAAPARSDAAAPAASLQPQPAVSRADTAAPAAPLQSQASPARSDTGAPPTRVATASAAPTTPGSGRAGGPAVQLGAFSSEAGANREWQALTGRFGPELQGLSAHIVAADTPSGRLYRLQARVMDEPRARAICDALKKRSQACMPVVPH